MGIGVRPACSTIHFLAPSSRCHTIDFAELLDEMRRVLPANFRGDLIDSHIGVLQQLCGLGDAGRCDPCADGKARLRLDDRGDMRAALSWRGLGRGPEESAR